jgi:hypothetical protein
LRQRPGVRSLSKAAEPPSEAKHRCSILLRGIAFAATMMMRHCDGAGPRYSCDDPNGYCRSSCCNGRTYHVGYTAPLLRHHRRARPRHSGAGWIAQSARGGNSRSRKSSTNRTSHVPQSATASAPASRCRSSTELRRTHLISSSIIIMGRFSFKMARLGTSLARLGTSSAPIRAASCAAPTAGNPDSNRAHGMIVVGWRSVVPALRSQ